MILHPLPAGDIEVLAQEELRQEHLRAAVERRKRELRERAARPWWKRLFPYVITIRRVEDGTSQGHR